MMAKNLDRTDINPAFDTLGLTNGFAAQIHDRKAATGDRSSRL
jgi:hypothetical protein